MRGAAAAIGDDRRSALHHRHPVGIGVLRHQDRTVHEPIDVASALDQTHTPAHHRLADAQSRGQATALRLDLVGSDRAGLAARLDRLRTGLHHVELAAFAVLRPFDIHRATVMVLNGASPAAEHKDVRVGQHEGGAFGPRGRHVAGRPLAGARIDHLLRLAAEPLLDDRHEFGVRQQRLEHLILVGIDGALHDVLAEPPRRVDDHHLVKTCLGVDGEHDTGTAKIGAHHQLHSDRECDLHVIETFRLPVADGPIGEQRREAAPAGSEQRRLAANVEEGLLLTGKARIGQVLGSGARSHRDVHVRPARAAAQFGIGALNRGLDVGGKLSLQKDAANGLAGLGQ